MISWPSTLSKRGEGGPLPNKVATRLNLSVVLARVDDHREVFAPGRTRTFLTVETMHRSFRRSISISTAYAVAIDGVTRPRRDAPLWQEQLLARLRSFARNRLACHVQNASLRPNHRHPPHRIRTGYRAFWRSSFPLHRHRREAEPDARQPPQAGRPFPDRSWVMALKALMIRDCGRCRASNSLVVILPSSSSTICPSRSG